MSIKNKPIFYWGVHAVLTGPLVLLWAGVAYWFGYGSEAILKTVFPPMLVPLGLFALITAAFGWAAIHSINTPPDNRLARGIDTLLCIFTGLSMFIVAGQIMSQ
ncbi:MAG: hypothetical protein ACRD43_00820 [Pyrinomonadaceae bacterium]